MTSLCIDPLTRPSRRVATSLDASTDPERYYDALETYMREVAGRALLGDADAVRALRAESLEALRPVAAGSRTITAVQARGTAGARGLRVVGHLLKGDPMGETAASALFDRVLVESTPVSAMRARELFLRRELAFRFRMRDLSRPFRVLVMGAAAMPGALEAVKTACARGGASEVTLVDADESALECAAGAGSVPAGVRVEAIAADPVGLAFAEEHELPQQDLVLIPGHLDFAPDDVSARLLEYGYGVLASGGELLAGHFHRDLTALDRVLMEWWLEWYPYYRSPKEVGALVSKSGVRERGGRAAGMVRGPNVYVVVQRP